MNRPLLIVVLGVAVSSLASAGDNFRPMTTDSTTATTPRSMKGIADPAWFPESLSVVISNKTVSYVENPSLYHLTRQSYRPTKISMGTILSLRESGMKYMKFQVTSVSTNQVILQRMGTMKRQKVPLDIVENLTPGDK